MPDNVQVPCVLFCKCVHTSVLLLASSLYISHVVQLLLVFCIQMRLLFFLLALYPPAPYTGRSCAASANPIWNLRGTRPYLNPSAKVRLQSHESPPSIPKMKTPNFVIAVRDVGLTYDVFWDAIPVEFVSLFICLFVSLFHSYRSRPQ